jgi:cyclophilin family peptidyl-prolyl cis-trans isomerase
MRFVAALAAGAALLLALPAAAQGGGGPPAKPEIETFKGVAADPKAAVATAVGADPENTWVLDLSTGGRVSIRLRPDVAPKMVEQIKTLTRRKFYDGVVFHRVIDGPRTWRRAAIRPAPAPAVRPARRARRVQQSAPCPRRRLGGATEDVNSANSQFFIMFGPRLGFDHDYTVFGRVVEGMSGSTRSSAASRPRTRPDRPRLYRRGQSAGVPGRPGRRAGAAGG